jgi:hypothetical protein
MNTARSFGITVLCILTAAAASARDLKLANGEIYKNIDVTQKDATGLQITHDDGIAFVDFIRLGPAEQKEFGYDPAAYAEGWKQKIAADKARREQQALTAQQLAAAHAKAQADAAANNKFPTDVSKQSPPLAPYTPTNQTGVEYYLETPGFRYGPYDYYGRGFSNVIPPNMGGRVVPYPYNANGPYPYYYGPTVGPTIIRQR